MNYFIVAAVTAFLSIPQVAYEKQNSNPFAVLPVTAEEKPVEPEDLIPDVLKRIAICESQGRHFDESGQVLKGEVNKYDVGKYQINVLYWQELATELGHDLYTEKGNEAMALEIFNRYGSAPWIWSKKCWNK